MDKLYSAKEIQEMLGLSTKDRPSKDLILRRLENAGLKGELAQTKPMYLFKIEGQLNLDEEIWVDTYCSSNYEVSNFGRVRRKIGKRLVGFTTTEGYVRVYFLENKQEYSVHRLVYFSFHPEFLENIKNIDIDHIDGRRSNNSLENLQPLTFLENTEKMKEGQKRIRTITTQLLVKYGYDELLNKLQDLLEDA